MKALHRPTKFEGGGGDNDEDTERHSFRTLQFVTVFSLRFDLSPTRRQIDTSAHTCQSLSANRVPRSK